LSDESAVGKASGAAVGVGCPGGIEQKIGPTGSAGHGRLRPVSPYAAPEATGYVNNHFTESEERQRM
jgi:hypothetical protein